MAWFQSDTLWISELADGVAVVNLDVPGSPGNPLTAAVFADLGRALDAVQERGQFRLLLVRSVKPGHFANGPTVAELAALKTDDDFVRFAQVGQEMLQRLAGFPIPSVAIIAGECLGAGLELALACDYRVVIDEPTTRLAIVDLDLGLLPCWGGTQRLPRVIGLERSFHVLQSGGKIGPATALAWGLADALAQHSDEPPSMLENAVKQPRTTLPLSTWRQFFVEGMPPGRWLLFRGFERFLKRVVPDGLPAPWEILPALRHATKRDPGDGQAFERETFVRLVRSDAFRHLLQLELRRDGLRQTTSTGSFRLAIVGSGEPALQLLYLAARRGDHVVIRSPDETALGMILFQAHTLFMRTLGEESAHRILARISGTTSWKGFADVDVVLVTKSTPFREIEAEVRSDAVLVTMLGESVKHLVADMQHRERVAGLSIVAPEEDEFLAEIAADTLQQAALTKLSAWVAHKGGIALPVRDRPGYVVQRVWLAAIHEAILLLEEGQEIARLDETLHHFGVNPGPLEMADRMGIPRLIKLAERFPDRFPRLLVFCAGMMSNGWLGRQNGVGFYEYKKRTATPNRRIPVPPPSVPLPAEDIYEYISERIVTRFVNEAAWCLEEGGVEDPALIDLALATSGWAPHRGGPLAFARREGVDRVVSWLEELATRHDARFLPCPALRRLR